MPNFRSRWIDWAPGPCDDIEESERRPFVSIVSAVPKRFENATTSPRTDLNPESPRYGTDKTDKSQPTPYQQAEIDWQAAIARALAGFDRHAFEPSAECLEGAAMLELWIADGKPPRPGATLDDLRDWVDSVYGGRSIARLTETARVVLRSVPRDGSPD